jgi:hypothetical protein
MSAAETATVTRTRTPWSSPQPIDPKIHFEEQWQADRESSPRRSPRRPRVAERRDLPEPVGISPSSAFASLMWASTRRRPRQRGRDLAPGAVVAVVAPGARAHRPAAAVEAAASRIRPSL